MPVMKNTFFLFCYMNRLYPELKKQNNIDLSFIDCLGWRIKLAKSASPTEEFDDGANMGLA